MNNALTITHAPLSPPLAEIEASTPRCRIPIRRFRNCLSLPETGVISYGSILITSGALVLGIGTGATVGVGVGVSVAASLITSGGVILLCGSIIALMKCYHREFSSSLLDIETQSPLSLIPEETGFQYDFFTSTAPPPYTEQSILPPVYKESSNFPCSPPPEYEESCTLSSTLPPEYEESYTLSSAPPQPSPSPTNEDDSPLQNTLPGLQFTYLV